MEAGMNTPRTVRDFLLLHWPELLIPVCVLAATLAVGYGAKRLLLRLLSRWAARSKGQTPAIVMNAIAGPFMIWVLILATHLAMQSSDLPTRSTTWIARLLLVLWILSITVMASRLAGNLIRLHGTGV